MFPPPPTGPLSPATLTRALERVVEFATLGEFGAPHAGPGNPLARDARPGRPVRVTRSGERADVIALPVAGGTRVAHLAPTTAAGRRRQGEGAVVLSFPPAGTNGRKRSHRPACERGAPPAPTATARRAPTRRLRLTPAAPPAPVTPLPLAHIAARAAEPTAARGPDHTAARAAEHTAAGDPERAGDVGARAGQPVSLLRRSGQRRTGVPAQAWRSPPGPDDAAA